MNLLYYKDSYLKKCNSKVLNVFDKDDKHYLILEDNIYYMQGGGQKSDKGFITYNNHTYNVLGCIKDENKNPIIITDVLLPLTAINNIVVCNLDWNFRYSQMKLHTALHLLHCLICKYYKKDIDYPISSNIENDFAYNKYPQEIITDECLQFVQSMFDTLLKSDILVTTYEDLNNPTYRYWKCIEYVIPCCGTHVNNLNEINHVNINCHTKKGITTIKLTL